MLINAFSQLIMFLIMCHNCKLSIEKRYFRHLPTTNDCFLSQKPDKSFEPLMLCFVRLRVSEWVDYEWGLFKRIMAILIDAGSRNVEINFKTIKIKYLWSSFEESENRKMIYYERRRAKGSRGEALSGIIAA